MIQTIYIYNYVEMEERLKTLPYDARIIGCIDTKLVNTPLFETDDYKLLLQFDDCIPNDGSEYQPMSNEQAEQIIRFVLNLVEGRVRHDIHIHCIGGQARSAAIAQFILWVANLERKHIRTNNPFRPNQHVENTLEKVYRSYVMGGSLQ